MGIWPGRVTCADREIHTCHTLQHITAHFEHWSNVRVVEVSLEIYKHIINDDLNKNAEMFKIFYQISK